MKLKLRIVKRWEWSRVTKKWFGWYCVEKFVAATWFSKEKWVEIVAYLSIEHARERCAEILREYRYSRNPKHRTEEIIWKSK